MLCSATVFSQTKAISRPPYQQLINKRNYHRKQTHTHDLHTRSSGLCCDNEITHPTLRLWGGAIYSAFLDYIEWLHHIHTVCLCAVSDNIIIQHHSIIIIVVIVTGIRHHPFPPTTRLYYPVSVCMCANCYAIYYNIFVTNRQIPTHMRAATTLLPHHCAVKRIPILTNIATLYIIDRFSTTSFDRKDENDDE